MHYHNLFARAVGFALCLFSALAFSQTNLAVAPAPIQFVTVPAIRSTTPTLSHVTLMWDASPDQSVVGYYVRYGLQSATNFVQIDARNTVTCTISNLIIGSTYTFWAVSYNAVGEVSQPSNFVDYTVPLPPGPTVFIRVHSYAIDARAVPGATNSLQMSSNLTSWTTVTNYTGSNTIFTHIHTATTGPRFFRVIKL